MSLRFMTDANESPRDVLDDLRHNPQHYARTYHAPIMVREILEGIALDRAPGGLLDTEEGTRPIVVLDATLGGGGHTHALLDATAPHGHVISLDRDPEAIAHAHERLAAYGDRFTAVQSNYSAARDVLDQLGVDAVDALVLDAGVSSHQLDAPERGFSFRFDAPLDMRMGEDTQPLGAWLDAANHGQLARVLREYGEVKKAGKLAAAILDARSAGNLDTTTQLRDLVIQVAPSPRQQTINPATLVFQALRIAVNDELTHLRMVTDALPELLVPGGRAAFLSFHSLEDRIVKRGLRALARPKKYPPGVPVTADMEQGVLEILTPRPLRPSEEEVEANPRSRSALLRLARLHG